MESCSMAKVCLHSFCVVPVFLALETTGQVIPSLGLEELRPVFKGCWHPAPLRGVLPWHGVRFDPECSPPPPLVLPCRRGKDCVEDPPRIPDSAVFAPTNGSSGSSDSVPSYGGDGDGDGPAKACEVCIDTSLLREATDDANANTPPLWESEGFEEEKQTVTPVEICEGGRRELVGAL